MAYKRIVIDEKCIDLLNNCKKEYLNYHPDEQLDHISYNKLLKRVCTYYLEHD